ncbi:MAG: ArdC-like ssDNA-binding domain-containing protein, partial [Phenylobacterium sp.]|nr:ArdC-like ssDNA-binding domain-containing protein [Phenylobacterium sp.]
MTRPHETPRPDLYSRVTNAIVADLEAGVRPWTRPWSSEHLAGSVSRPLRSTGEPYSGINVVL